MIGFFWAWIVAICLWSHKAWVHYEEDMEELDSVDANPGVNTMMEQPYPEEAPGMQVDGKLLEKKRSDMEELDSVDAYPGVNTMMEQPYPEEAPGMQVDGKLPEEKQAAMI